MENKREDLMLNSRRVKTNPNAAKDTFEMWGELLDTILNLGVCHDKTQTSWKVKDMTLKRDREIS